MSEQEYLRLPHGMFDRDEEWIKRERAILENHAKSGEKIGCKLKKYSPLGYSSTFIRGANTAKDKVYTLNSKSGKSLILSCDSHSRHFTQIGYSMINEKKVDDENLDINLIQLARAMTDLFQKQRNKNKNMYQ